MKIAILHLREKSGRETVAYFEPRDMAVEPCAFVRNHGDRQEFGVCWLDMTTGFDSLPVKISETPSWNVAAAVVVAQDALSELDKAGRGAPLLARLRVVAPDYWESKIEGRKRLTSSARDIYILLMLPVWDEKKLSWAEKSAELHAAAGIQPFSKSADTAWRMLANRAKALAKRHGAD